MQAATGPRSPRPRAGPAWSRTPPRLRGAANLDPKPRTAARAGSGAREHLPSHVLVGCRPASLASAKGVRSAVPTAHGARSTPELLREGLELIRDERDAQFVRAGWSLFLLGPRLLLYRTQNGLQSLGILIIPYSGFCGIACGRRSHSETFIASDKRL